MRETLDWHAEYYRTQFNCLACGTYWGQPDHGDRACDVATCMLCQSPQCMGYGLGNGTCAICLYGLLPGWSGNDRKCGYAGCGNKAVARAPRIGYVCMEHTRRVKIGKLDTLAEYVVRHLEARDKQFVFWPPEGWTPP
jgi:hypothetical protein